MRLKEKWIMRLLRRCSIVRDHRVIWCGLLVSFISLISWLLCIEKSRVSEGLTRTFTPDAIWSIKYNFQTYPKEFLSLWFYHRYSLSMLHRWFIFIRLSYPYLPPFGDFSLSFTTSVRKQIPRRIHINSLSQLKNRRSYWKGSECNT
jgi:hypothetical protein